MSYTKNVLMREAMRRGHASRNRFVCGRCMGEPGLAEFVADHATKNECEFCGRKKKRPLAASLGDVIEYMAECIHQEYADPAGGLSHDSAEGGWIGSVLDGGDLLDTLDLHFESEDLYGEIVQAFSDQQWCKAEYYGPDPSERLEFGWDSFKRVVKNSRRFTFWSLNDASLLNPDSMPAGKMLGTLGACALEADLIKTIPRGKGIWRVRVHDAGSTLTADHDLGPPPVEKALQSNRMSPAGIVMFYGAEDFDTACAETVDPAKDIGKRVTGAVFKTARDLRILDLVDLPAMPSFFTLGTSDLRHTLRFLQAFARDLATPVVRDGHEHIEYVPTQAFTEYVRFELALTGGGNVDGIRYRSSINEETCYVLFCNQDQCIADPPPLAQGERWMEFDATSLRSIDIKASGKSGGRTPAKIRPVRTP